MSFGQLQSVRRSFDKLVAVEEATFSFAQGELVSLLGPSGCGKTTLLRIIAGLIPKSAGSVRIRGEEVDGPHPDFGFVFQTPNLMPWRNVLYNVLFPMEILHRSGERARERAMGLLGMVGLGGFHRARPHQLSGGM